MTFRTAVNEVLRASTGAPPRIAFVYGAREAILPEIVLALMNAGGLISEVFARCDEYVERRIGHSVRAVLKSADPYPEFMLEPALTATQIALTDAWRAEGIYPDAVVARCGGEFAGAYGRGALSRDNAMEMAC